MGANQQRDGISGVLVLREEFVLLGVFVEPRMVDEIEASHVISGASP